MIACAKCGARRSDMLQQAPPLGQKISSGSENTDSLEQVTFLSKTDENTVSDCQCSHSNEDELIACAKCGARRSDMLQQAPPLGQKISSGSENTDSLEQVTFLSKTDENTVSDCQCSHSNEDELIACAKCGARRSDMLQQAPLLGQKISSGSENTDSLEQVTFLSKTDENTVSDCQCSHSNEDELIACAKCGARRSDMLQQAPPLGQKISSGSENTDSLEQVAFLSKSDENTVSDCQCSHSNEDELIACAKCGARRSEMLQQVPPLGQKISSGSENTAKEKSDAIRRPKTGGGPKPASPSLAEGKILDGLADRPTLQGLLDGIDSEDFSIAVATVSEDPGLTLENFQQDSLEQVTFLSKSDENTVWVCQCNHSNEDDWIACPKCGTRRSEMLQQASPLGQNISSRDANTGRDCAKCTFINYGNGDRCEMCDSRRMSAAHQQQLQFQQPLQQQYETPLQQECQQKCQVRDRHPDSLEHVSFWSEKEENTAFLEKLYSGRSFVKGETRIVLIGKTGSGKSATGNNLAGRKAFRSTCSPSSITKQCQQEMGRRFDRHIQIVDTPGLFDTGISLKDTSKEIMKCVAMTSPGIHAIVLVTRVNRFTEEEQKTVEHFKKVFGEDVVNYMVIVFTGKDELEVHGMTIENYVQEGPAPLRQLIAQCNRRFFVVSNLASEGDKDSWSKNFLTEVDRMVQANGGRCYTAAMYRKAEAIMKQREEELKRKIEEEKRAERELIEQNIKVKYDAVARRQNEMMQNLQHELQNMAEKEEQDKQRHQQAVEAMEEKILKAEKERKKMGEDRMKWEEERRKEMEKNEKDEKHNREIEELARERARAEVASGKGSILGKLWAAIGEFVSFIRSRFS